MNKKSFTITELLIVILALSIVVGVGVRVYMTSLYVWNQGMSRSEIRTDLVQALELITKQLRKARSISNIQQGSITYTADLGGGVKIYRLYLYEASDAEPNPPYTVNLYNLMMAETTVTYGSGIVLARNIMQPVNTPFSQTGNMITLDLTVKDSDNQIRMRTNVTPRNL